MGFWHVIFNSATIEVANYRYCLEHLVDLSIQDEHDWPKRSKNSIRSFHWKNLFVRIESSWLRPPPVIKHGNGKSNVNGGLNGKLTDKWWIFHCHVWLPEGIWFYSGDVSCLIIWSVILLKGSFLCGFPRHDHQKAKGCPSQPSGSTSNKHQQTLVTWSCKVSNGDSTASLRYIASPISRYCKPKCSFSSFQLPGFSSQIPTCTCFRWRFGTFLIFPFTWE